MEWDFNHTYVFGQVNQDIIFEYKFNIKYILID
jgi:hypothetical protein